MKRRGFLLEALLSSAISYIIFVIIAIILVTLIQSRSGIQVVPLYLIALSLIPSQLAFGFVLSSFFHGRAKRISPEVPEVPEPIPAQPTDAMDVVYSRKAFLRLAAAAAVALPIIWLGVDKLLSRQNEAQEQASTTTNLLPQTGPKPKGFEDPNLTPLLASEVTPTY